MPKELHDQLAREADEKGLTGERRDAYIYGTMRRVEEGRTMSDDKHDAKRCAVCGGRIVPRFKPGSDPRTARRIGWSHTWEPSGYGEHAPRPEGK